MTNSGTTARFQPPDTIESGHSDATNLGADLPEKLIVASYNIRYGVGSRLISSGLLRKAGLRVPRKRSEAIAMNIQRAARAFTEGVLCPPVDVLALQESDKATARSGGHHLAAELARTMGFSWLHAPAGIPRGIPPQQREWWLDFEEQIGLHDEGDTGVALLSRFAFSDVERIDLPWHDCPWRPRVSLAATLGRDLRQIRIFNAHIDPHGPVGNQLEQLKVVLDETDRIAGPVLLLGDFNTLSNQKCIEARQLVESRGFQTPFPTGTPTWRGAGLRFHADWIFSRGAMITCWGVVRPLSVSDHWPIWAEIALAD